MRGKQSESMIFPKVSSVPGQKAPAPLPSRNRTRRRARPRGVLPGPWLLPGRSEAEHPGAAGGEIWAGHHERSLTGEKQRKSWGPATREPRGNHAGDGETAGSYNTGTHSGVGEGPPATSLRTGACAPGPADSRARLPPLRREPCLGPAVPATVPGGQIPGTRDSRAKSPALVSLQGP